MNKIENPKNAIDKNINLLIGLYLEIKHISSAYYKQKTASSGSMGPHVRHLLNFYQIFLEAFNTDDVVNFQKRKDNYMIEQNRDAGLNAIKDVIIGLQLIDDSFLEEKIMWQDSGNVIKVTLEVIFRYLKSHTVHHNATIRSIIRLLTWDKEEFNFQDEFFGYEESTIEKIVSQRKTI